MVTVWIIFTVVVLGLLALDLGVFNREPHVVSVKEALGWTCFWITLSLAFIGVIALMYGNHWGGAGLDADGHVIRDGSQASLEYLTGYVLEKALSVDNIFVIALIFGFFRVPPQYQHRVLFWGILGALIFRGIMIGVGAFLVAQFSWIFYVFGGLLIVAAAKMLLMSDDDVDPEKSWILRLARRVMPVTKEYRDERFTVRVDGRLFITPLMLVLLVIEATDVLFAVDSIPAIFGVFEDPAHADAFIVFSSNVFAILGLRSLYFVLAGMLDKFRYLSPALALVLIVIGVKMLLHDVLHDVDRNLLLSSTLSAVAIILLLGVLLSVRANRRDARMGSQPGRDAPAAQAEADDASEPDGRSNGEAEVAERRFERVPTIPPA